MRLTDLLALSHVPRWTIVPHIFQQTVGDHTFRVLVIYTELCKRLNQEIRLDSLMHILEHDADEARTGDIPTPAKEDLVQLNPDVFTPWGEWRYLQVGPQTSLFAVADFLEAYTFIEKYGKGDHSRRVAAEMFGKLRQLCPPEWWTTVSGVIDDITFETGR